MGDLSTSTQQEAEHQSLDEFANTLAAESIEESVLDAFVAICEQEADADQGSASHEELDITPVKISFSKKDYPLDVRIVHSILNAFTLQNMTKCLVFLLGFILAGTIWDFIVEVYSRPTILKPRSPHPFFSNHSSAYLDDFYTGNFHPERFVRHSDLLVVMYYAPWSFHSRTLKHPFEVVALLLRNHKNVRFVAVNCWTASGECRNSFKIYQFPLVVAYSSNVHTVYQGEHSVDHLYRWVVNVRTPLRFIGSMDELQSMKQEFHTLVVGYFPFKNMGPPVGYRAFAAAGMILQTGSIEDDSTCLAVVTSARIAEEIGLRSEGDMLLTSPKDFESVWSYGADVTAQSIVDWVRDNREVSAPVKWIHFNKNTELMTEQFARLLNQSSVLMLVTSITPVYRNQNDVKLFTKLAREYWDCEEQHLLSMKPFSSMLSEPKSISQEVSSDMQACAEVQEDIVKANALLTRCCDYYDEMNEPRITATQKIIARARLRDRELRLADLCMRGRLYEYMKYPDRYENVDMFGELEPPANRSIRGMGCRANAGNDTLKFLVLDSLHYQYFVSKWGLTKAQLPLVIAIDISRELFSVMDSTFTLKSVREFIRDYHSYLVSDHLVSEEDSRIRFDMTVDVKPVHYRISEEHFLEKLTLRSFQELIENRQNTSHDVVVFFSGGVWHSPSMTAIHVLHDTANYFSTSKDLIKFYIIDSTRNELPYNFNFDRIPAVVIFLANQTDVSWKYPEALPFSQPNMLSFVLSHCSARLRWKMALTNCGRVCVTYNRRRLRKRQEKLLQAIHRIRESPYRKFHTSKLQYFVRQLRVVRRVLRALHVALHQSEVLSEELVNGLLNSSIFEEYIRAQIE
ncbi:hypothetical protein Q1695_002552 [Nippostrongylus brasiliensis]|nr:hypothetical protein Q1695_002552 [Nippostrongylus brasiliensis]